VRIYAAQEASSGAPWWATAILSGTFALAGVGLGGFINWRFERGRRNREQLRRMDTAVRETSAQLLTAVASYQSKMLMVHELTPKDDEQAEELYDITHDITMLYVSITLVAPPAITNIAAEVNAVISDFYLNWHRAEGELPLDRALSGTALYRKLDDLMASYTAAVREHFGLSPSPLFRTAESPDLRD